MSNKQIDITKEVMSKIDKGQVRMRPRWEFVAGGLAVILGIVGVYFCSVFLVSLLSFSLRTHGPLASMRLQELLSSFPWWAVILIAIGFVLGGFLLRTYDFAYKRNFLMIIIAFVVAILLSGWLADYWGLETVWPKEGQVQKLYQQYDGRRKMYLQNQEEVPASGRKNGQMRRNSYN